MLGFVVTAGEADPMSPASRKRACRITANVEDAGNGVGVYFGDPDGNPLALSCNEGYVREGLPRNVRSWAPAPYGWPQAAAPAR